MGNGGWQSGWGGVLIAGQTIGPRQVLKESTGWVYSGRRRPQAVKKLPNVELYAHRTGYSRTIPERGRQHASTNASAPQLPTPRNPGRPW